MTSTPDTGTAAGRQDGPGGDGADLDTLVVMLSEGHLLIEDVPGVGKTMLA